MLKCIRELIKISRQLRKKLPLKLRVPLFGTGDGADRPINVTRHGENANMKMDRPGDSVEGVANNATKGITLSESHEILMGGYARKGVYHAAHGLPLQDSVSCGAKNGVYAIAVADGLGSYPNSQIGSQATTSSTINYLTTDGVFDDWCVSKDDSKFIANLVERVKMAIDEEATSNGVLIDDVPCTLLFAATDGNRSIYGKIGDGAIFLVCNDDYERLFETEDPESEGTETILDPEVAADFEIEHRDVRDGDLGVIITTDGMRYVGYLPISRALLDGLHSVYCAFVDSEGTDGDGALANAMNHDELFSSGDDIGVAIIAFSRKKPCYSACSDWFCSCGRQNDYGNIACSNCGMSFEDVYNLEPFGKISDRLRFIATYSRLISEEHSINERTIKKWLKGITIYEYQGLARVLNRIASPNSLAVREGPVITASPSERIYDKK